MDADDRDRATRPDGREGVRERSVGGDRVDHRVGAEAAGGLEHRVDGGPSSATAPDSTAAGAAAGDRVDREHPAGALEQGRPDGAQADGAEAQHDDGPARRDVARAARRPSRCRGCRSAAARPRRRRRRGPRAAGSPRPARRAARLWPPPSSPEPNTFGPCTQVTGSPVAQPAHRPQPATEATSTRSPTATRRTSGTDLDHGADHLVPDGDREQRQVAVVEVQVRSADRGGVTWMTAPSGPGKLRVGHVVDRHLSGSLDHHSAHGSGP